LKNSQPILSGKPSQEISVLAKGDAYRYNIILHPPPPQRRETIPDQLHLPLVDPENHAITVSEEPIRRLVNYPADPTQATGATRTIDLVSDHHTDQQKSTVNLDRVDITRSAEDTSDTATTTGPALVSDTDKPARHQPSNDSPRRTPPATHLAASHVGTVGAHQPHHAARIMAGSEAAPTLDFGM